MKKMITLIALAITTFTQAQTAIEVPNSMLVQENDYMLQNKMRNGFEIMVQGEAKAILKAFEDYLKSEHDFKVKSSGGLISGAELTNIKVSEKRFSLYALIKEDGEGNHLRLWMAPGLDIYYSTKTHPLEASSAKNILKSFVKSYYSTFLNANLEKTNKEVENASATLEDFVKEEQTAGKQILKKEKSIGKAEARLLKSQEKIEKLQVAIEDLKNNKVELGTEIESLKTSQIEIKGKIQSTRETYNQKVALSKQQKANLERLQNL